MKTDSKFIFLTGEVNELESDCDCACPDYPFQMNFADISRLKFSVVKDRYCINLPNHFFLLFSVFAPNGPCVVNQESFNRLQEFIDAPTVLSQDIDYRFAEQNLLVPHEENLNIDLNKPDTLTVWLHVTNACNLDCPYCYVRKSSSRMSTEIGINAISKVFDAARLSGFKKVKLKYAGGEATLHFNLVQLLHAHAIKLATKFNIQLSGVVLSNGVSIKPNVVNWLKSSGLKLMISLDGIGNVHDKLRPLKNGGNTFSSIERNIDEHLIPAGIKPDISVTVTRINAEKVADLVEWILDRDLPFSLNFYRENPLSSSRKELQLEEATIIEGLEKAYSVIERKLPVQPLINSLLDKVRIQAHTHTCGVGKAYVVINQNGGLSQCQMHLDQPVSGNFESSNLIPLVEKGVIKNLTVDSKKGCEDCVYRYRCSGGCPLETFRATGRWDVKSPNCNIYQALFPQVLRLEGLRLMKLFGYL